MSKFRNLDSIMDDKSVPYNLRLRKDHKSSPSLLEPCKNHNQERDFQGGEDVYGGHLGVNYKCEKCGCSFDLQTSLHSHHCRGKMNEKEAMENELQESLRDKSSFRKRSRKGIPIRAPFF